MQREKSVSPAQPSPLHHSRWPPRPAYRLCSLDSPQISYARWAFSSILKVGSYRFRQGMPRTSLVSAHVSAIQLAHAPVCDRFPRQLQGVSFPPCATLAMQPFYRAISAKSSMRLAYPSILPSPLQPLFSPRQDSPHTLKPIQQPLLHLHHHLYSMIAWPMRPGYTVLDITLSYSLRYALRAPLRVFQFRSRRPSPATLALRPSVPDRVFRLLRRRG